MDIINGSNNAEDTDMEADCDGEKVVTMMDVLQEQQDFEEDANAVLGASDDKNCTYAKGYIKRQALYSCLTCCSDAKFDATKRAAVCLACSLNCHENHEVLELYTKRNFRCDCGNKKFNAPCQLNPDKTDYNEDNVYNQNFNGLYCNCSRPYPDPESTEDDDMIQCIVCEDWLHSAHLGATVPANDEYSEMICKACMEKNEFLYDYTCYAVNVQEHGHVDVVTNELDVPTSVNNLSLSNEKVTVTNVEKDVTNQSENVEIIESSDKNLNFLETDDQNLNKNVLEKEMIPQDNNISQQSTEDSVESKVDEIKPMELENDSIGKVEDKENQSAIIQKFNDSVIPNKDEDVENITSNTETSENGGEPSNITTDSIDEKITKDSKVTNKDDETVENITNDKNSNTKTLSENGEEPSNTTTDGIDEKTISDSKVTNRQDESVENNTNDKNSNTKTSSENGDKPSNITDGIDEKTISDTKVTNKQDESVENNTNDKNSNTETSSKNGEELSNVTTDNVNDKIASDSKVTNEQDKAVENNISDKKSNAEILSENGEEPSNVITDSIDDKIANDSKVCTNKTENYPEEVSRDKIQDIAETTNNLEINISLENDNKPISTDDSAKVKVAETQNNIEIKSDSIKSTEEDIKDSGENGGNIEETNEIKLLHENKRKLSEDPEAHGSIKKPKIQGEECRKPRGGKIKFEGATFWSSNFRQKLCTCNDCIKMYKDLSVLFLIDLEDTVTAYETLGKEIIDGAPVSQYEKGLQALSSLGRVQQINALTEYNNMRDKLLDFLKSFKDKQIVVKEDDIKAFFAGMKPKRESDGVYFCR